MKPLVLIVLDGWGVGAKTQANPIHQAPAPTFDWMKQNFPYLALQASGIAVGLPWGQVGDSEVGHLTIGAGRVIWQHYPRITMAIKDGSFFTNKALTDACVHARTKGTKLHLVGLLSKANYQASLEHLEALLKLAQDQNVSPLLHLFTDGKEAKPREAQGLLAQLAETMKKYGSGRVASLSGRFYAMDRDQHWERTEKVYTLLAKGNKIKASADEILEEAYSRSLTDEFVEPSLIGKPEDIPNLIVQPGDAVVFFNYREDHIRQLSQLFDKFSEKESGDILLVNFTEYAAGLKASVAFPPEKTSLPLGAVLASAGKRQLRLAESEKAAHVTFFFNGLNTQPSSEEYWVIVPSSKTIRFEERPELSLAEVQNRLIEAMEEGIYDFIVANFANPDLIGHTGNFEAAAKVVEIVDRAINRIANTALKLKAPLVITADHGNMEQMLDPMSGRPETLHNSNSVPFHLVDERFMRPRSSEEIERAEHEVRGALADVAPTILELMQIPKPPEMTGNSLLRYCK